MAASRITSITESITINNTAQNLYVGITADVQTYYHTIVVTLGNQTVTRNVPTAGSLTDAVPIPPSILNGMTTSATGTANVTLRTYTNSSRTTLVGTATSSFTVRCTASPTIGSFTAAVGTNSQAYAAGITDKYVMGYSTCLLTASNVSAKYGATIVSYRFYSYNYANNWSKSITSSASSASTTSPEIPASSSMGFWVDVTDSRGLKQTGTVNISPVSIYDIGWAITLSNTEIFRCNSSGVADDNGTYISVKTTATATPSQNSVKELFFMTRETGEGGYTGKTALTSGTAKIKSGFDVDKSYDIVIQSVDAFDRDEWLYVTTVYGALITMDFKEGGKGIAIGKVADNEEQVDSAWDIKTDGNLIIDSNEVITDVNGKPSVKFTDVYDDTYAEIVAPTVDMSFNFVRYGETYDSTTGEDHVNPNVSETYSLPNDYGITGNKRYKIITTKEPVTIAQGGTGQTDWITYNPTRTENAYANATSVNRVIIRKWGKMGVLRCNLSLSEDMPAKTEFTEIARYSIPALKESVNVVIAGQSGSGNLLLSMSSAGVLTIGNYTSSVASGWYRINIPLMFA